MKNARSGFKNSLFINWARASLIDQLIKNLPGMRKILGLPIPGSGRSAEEGIGYQLQCSWASLVAQLVKNPPAKQKFSSVQLLSCIWLFATPWTIWNSPGQNTGVGSLSLFQEIFPTQESNPGLLHCRQILFQLSHKGSPRTPEWVAYPFSRGSSQPRIRTWISYIADRFFTNWAMREAPGHWIWEFKHTF